MIYVLGLDLGTSTGWALLRDGARVRSGTCVLKREKKKPGVRLASFHALLSNRVNEALDAIEVTHGSLVVAYEGAKFQRGAAREVWWGLYGILRYVCDPRGITCVEAPVTTVKRRATGNGRASKEEMVDAAKSGFGVLDLTDDEADALWTAQVVWEQLADGN